MAKPVKITVRGAEAAGAEAPAAGDALSQIQDLIAIFQGAEAFLEKPGQKKDLVWCITDASMQSPLTVDVTPHPSHPDAGAESRVFEVVCMAAELLDATAAKGGRQVLPDRLAQKIKKVHVRVTNGLAETTVDFSAYGNALKIRIDPATAREVLKRLEADSASDEFAEPVPSSVEGFVCGVGMDGDTQRPVLWLRSRLDGKVLRCTATERGAKCIKDLRMEDVLDGLRVCVEGLVKYKSFGNIEAVEIDDIFFFKPDHELPEPEDIISPNFTQGVEAVEYVRRLREHG